MRTRTNAVQKEQEVNKN